MRVVYVQYTNPGVYPPLVRGAQLLVESGAQVLMLGIEVPGLDAMSVEPRDGVTVRLLAAPASDSTGWRLKTHYARYAAWVAGEASAWKPDWIYASDILSAPIALMLRSLTGGRVIYHEHDAPAVEHSSWMLRQCLSARQRLARTADLVIVPNAERAERLSREVAGGRQVHTVWNCPRRPTSAVSADRLVASSGSPDAPLRVVFCGSINRERLPLTVIDALAGGAENVGLDIAGYETEGSRGYLDTLAAHAERLGVGPRVRVLGTVAPRDLAPLCEGCDVGLALMPAASADENMRHMAGASNKVFEYLMYGVTPLVTDSEDWRAAFVAPGYALACDPDDAESIRRALVWASTHRRELRAMADRGLARLRHDWNYETQFAPIIQAMLELGFGETAATAQAVRCAS